MARQVWMRKLKLSDNILAFHDRSSIQTIPDDLQQNKTRLQEAGLVNKLLECPLL